MNTPLNKNAVIGITCIYCLFFMATAAPGRDSEPADDQGRLWTMTEINLHASIYPDSGFLVGEGTRLTALIKPFKDILELKGTDRIIISQRGSVKECLHRLIFPTHPPWQVILHCLAAAIPLQTPAIPVHIPGTSQPTLIAAALANHL